MNDPTTTHIPHYYGDIVRFLFMTSAVIMALGLPSVSNYLQIPPILSIISISVLGLAAGLTNPKQIWDASINTIIAVVGFFTFESYAVLAFSESSLHDKFFLSNLFLGCIFLVAVYFSVKTLRGMTSTNAPR